MNIERLDHFDQSARIRAQMPAYLDEMTGFLADPRPTTPGQARTYPYLDHYWSDPDRTPYIIMNQEVDCGFALVRKIRSGDSNPDTYSIAEFFIQASERRLGVGGQAVADLLSKHSGPWLIQVLELNSSALKFWQRTLLNIVGEALASPQLTGGFYNFRLTI